MRWWAVALFLTPTGCFLGYDSRWGQQKQAQKNFAQAETPSSLAAQKKRGMIARSAPRKLRVRVDVTPTYSAQVVDWQRRFADTLTLVNGILEPTLAITLELVGTRTWNPESEDDLEALLQRLPQNDAGEDADWVVGLVGAVPRFEDSFHELGRGQVVGKYLVVRAISNAAEFQAFEEGLSELTEDERAKLRRARLSHKTAAVLLHEIGHTLGALHEREATNLMNPRYGKIAGHFGPEAVEMMRGVLEHRTVEGALDDEGQRALLARLNAEPSPFVPEERAKQVRTLTAGAAGMGSHASTTTTGPGSPEVPTTREVAAPLALSPEDRSSFVEARRALGAGNPEAARKLAAPLFDRYPQLPEVQELRCQIALQRGASWQATRVECASLMPGAPRAPAP